MDLKTRKYINNTKCLPKFLVGTGHESQSIDDLQNNRLQGYSINQPNGNAAATSNFASRWNNGAGQQITGAIPSVIGATGSIASSAQPTLQTNDLLSKAGTSRGQVNGVGYTILNDVNREEAMDLVNQQIGANTMQTTLMGSSAGMGIGMGAGMLAEAAGGGWGGPIGMAAGALLGLVGGLIGGHSRRKRERARIRRAEITAQTINEANRDQAVTTALRNSQAEDFGDTASQQLYHAAEGAEKVNPRTGETYKRHNVNTSHGKVWMPQNAWVLKNEKIVGEDGSVYRVKEGPNDTAKAYLFPGDSVMSNIKINPETGNTYADDTESYLAAGLFDHLLDLQKHTNPMTNKNLMLHAKYGVEKFPKYSIGWENLAATVPGIITSVYDLINTKRQPIHRTDINPYNKYEGRVNELLSSRTPNVYPQLQQVTSSERAQQNANNMSGGLSAGQKMALNITNSMNSRLARMNALINAQNLYNQFKKENADIISNMGNHLMNENVRAQMFNEQQNAAAHNSWIQGWNMAKRNILDYAAQFAKNVWEKNQFDRMYKLYAADIASRSPKKTKEGKTIKVKNSPLQLPPEKQWTPYNWSDSFPQYEWPIKFGE